MKINTFYIIIIALFPLFFKAIQALSLNSKTQVLADNKSNIVINKTLKSNTTITKQNITNIQNKTIKQNITSHKHRFNNESLNQTNSNISSTLIKTIDDGRLSCDETNDYFEALDDIKQSLNEIKAAYKQRVEYYENSPLEATEKLQNYKEVITNQAYSQLSSLKELENVFSSLKFASNEIKNKKCFKQVTTALLITNKRITGFIKKIED